MAIRTNREYVIKLLQPFDIDESFIDIMFADHPELNNEEKVEPKACKLMIYNEMSSVLPALTKNVSEGGYSQTWNMEGVKMWYSALCNELGKKDVLAVKRPRVRNRSNYW